MAISEQILHPSAVPAVPAAPVPEPAPSVPVPAPVQVQVPDAEPVQVPAPEVIEALPDEDVTFGCLVLRAGTAGWRAAKCAVKMLGSLRTLLFFGVTGGLFLTAKLSDVNVAQFVSKVVGGRVDPEDLLMFMSVGGIVLRFITTTPVFDRWRKAAKGGMVISDSDGGSVDEGD